MIDVDVLKERALKDPEIKAEYDLAVLLGAINPENVHEEVDFGAAVGQELGAGRYSPRLSTQNSWLSSFSNNNQAGRSNMPPLLAWALKVLGMTFEGFLAKNGISGADWNSFTTNNAPPWLSREIWRAIHSLGLEARRRFDHELAEIAAQIAAYPEPASPPKPKTFDSPSFG
jgi:hypothetical protein